MNIPLELRSDFKQPSPAEAEKLRLDLAIYGQCVRDQKGRRIPPDYWWQIDEKAAV